jgi:hypothetical protein
MDAILRMTTASSPQMGFFTLLSLFQKKKEEAYKIILLSLRVLFSVYITSGWTTEKPLPPIAGWLSVPSVFCQKKVDD